MHRNFQFDFSSSLALLMNRIRMSHFFKHREGAAGIDRCQSAVWLAVILITFALSPAHTQAQDATLQTASVTPIAAKEKKAPEQEIIIEGEVCWQLQDLCSG